jgi:hypothetical protein
MTDLMKTIGAGVVLLVHVRVVLLMPGPKRVGAKNVPRWITAVPEHYS